MRIGFLLNHEGTHQVRHAMPIASALVTFDPRVEVEIFVSNDLVEKEVRRSIDATSSQILINKLKNAGWVGKTVSALSGDAVPGRRISILRRNRLRFKKLDALVVPEKTSLMLKSHFGLSGLPLIHTRHGAGDRAVGFDKSSNKFDLVLLAGKKIRDRLEESNLLKDNGFAIVGYPKFECDRSGEKERIFNNGLPTVLYNPHPSPSLSSWYEMGQEVLELFASQKDFNLIFAPHIMLFKRKYHLSLDPLRIKRAIFAHKNFNSLENIHIDLGSPLSVDMTYTQEADIYIGDVSSQVYEFLHRPRPCIFLNPLDLDWEGDPNFAHWVAGPVVSNVEQLKYAVETAAARHSAYRGLQEKLFSYTFDIQAERSSMRAARAICEWLQSRSR